MTRQTKTPKQRAQEQLDTARRIEKRLARRRDTLRSELADITTEHDAAAARVEFLAKHPDLHLHQQQTRSTSTTTTPDRSTTP